MKTITLKVLFFLVCLNISYKPAYAQAPDFSIAGFATENGGTTGGAGGTEVTVTTYTELKKYAKIPDEKYIIKIAGTIKGSGSVTDKNYEGEIKVASNKTIIGIGNTAFLDGIGLSIKDTKNVIIQNIRFSLVSVGKSIPLKSGDIPDIYSVKGDEGRPQILVNGGDLIKIHGASSNIWIDHCEFSEEDPRLQTNQDLYDGLIDVSNNSGFITISWSYFHDHHKCHLIGNADKDLYVDRKVTFHHNYYKKIQERVPLYRGGTGHFFNNYNYDVYAGSVNSRVDACVRVEKNYFEKCKNTVYSKNSTILGKAERIDNKEINCGSSVYPSACVTSIPYNYSKVLSKVDDIKTIVITYAGVGK
jgi:pectate lyase